MSLPVQEERSFKALLRRNTTLLRRILNHRASQTSAPDTARKPAISAEVSPVLADDRERCRIPMLLREVRRRRSLRYQPDMRDEYTPLTPYAADYFLEQTRSAHIDTWREAVVSLWALGRLTPDNPGYAEAEQHLCRLIGSDSSMAQIDGKRLGRRWRFILSYLIGGMSVWSLWAGLSAAPHGGWLVLVAGIVTGALFYSLPLTVLAFLIGAPLDRMHLARIRAMAILTLGRRRDTCHLGLILRQYVEERGRVHRAAEVVLLEVLPLLGMPDAAMLPRDFVPNLCIALYRKERQVLDYTAREEKLEVLLLEALSKVGDGRALPTVERIAQAGRTPLLRELAQSLVPILQERRRLEIDSDQLLRGATQPETAPETLLRPAQNEDVTPPDQLLRPLASDTGHHPLPIQRHGS